MDFPFSVFSYFFFPLTEDPLTFQGRFNVGEFLVFASQSSLSLLFYLLIFLSKVYWVSNLKSLSALRIHHDTPWPAKVLQRNRLIWTVSLCRPLQIYDVLTVQTCVLYSESVWGASSLFLSWPITDPVYSAHTLLRNHSVCQVGPHVLLPRAWGKSWWSGCRQRSRLLLMWCFCKHQTCRCCSTQAPPRDQVTSVSHNWVFFLVGRKVVFLVSQPDKRASLPCIAPQAWGTLPMACIACSPGKMSFHVKFHFLRAPSQGHGP